MPHAPLMRERQSPSSSPPPGGQDDHNPFAPPPEGSPDQPWRPRHQPSGGSGGTGGEGNGDGARGPGGNGGQGGDPGGQDNGPGGQGDAPWGPGQGNGAGGPGGPGAGGPWGPGGQGNGPWGPGGQGGQGGQGDGAGGPQQPGQPPQPPAWGSQWSSRQPGRQSGGWGNNQGERPNGRDGQRGSGPRWDPSDPAQRRARYALLAGIWALFFALFSLPEIALLLGALGLYWSISALRAKPRRSGPGRAAAVDAPPPPPNAQRTPLPAPRANGAKPQATAAISGLVTAGVAMVIVVATYSAQLIYSDYYTCVDDALTKTSREQCEQKLPEQLRPLLSTDD